jgi:hypothetical protein
MCRRRAAIEVACFLLYETLSSFRALAVDPTQTLSELHHTRWTTRDGAPAGMYVLEQTSDGFLWIGATTRLFRFDGKGLESSVQSNGRRPRHFGLQGMRERAQKMGGVFNLWTKHRAGIEIELIVPAGVAYQEEHTRSFRSISKKFAFRWRR